MPDRNTTTSIALQTRHLLFRATGLIAGTCLLLAGFVPWRAVVEIPVSSIEREQAAAFAFPLRPFEVHEASDPANGQPFRLTCPRSLASIGHRFRGWSSAVGPIRLVVGWLLIALALNPVTTASWQSRWHWLKYRILPTALVLVLLIPTALGLRANAINVLGTAGRFAHGLAAAFLLVLFCVNLFVLFYSFRIDVVRSFGACGLWYMGAATTLLNTITLLLALECMARVFPTVDSLEQNPGSHFFWPEWYEPRNSLGYHDREPGEKTGPRVLLLGDSYAEGAGVHRVERVSNQLENIWRGAVPSIEIYAGARCGFDTIDEARLLEQTGDAVKPDLVIVCYVLNDAERDSEVTAAMTAPAAWKRFLITDCHSYLCYWAYALRHRAASASIDAAIQAQHRPDSPGWRHVLNGLDRIAAWCDQRQVSKGLVVFPCFAAGTEMHREIMDRVAAAARDRGFEAYNLLDIYQGRWGEMGISPFDRHPNSRAHATTARYLSEVFLLPRARGSTGKSTTPRETDERDSEKQGSKAVGAWTSNVR